MRRRDFLRNMAAATAMATDGLPYIWSRAGSAFEIADNPFRTTKGPNISKL